MGDFTVGQALLKPARAGKSVMVFGPKGGVGKTTISAHLLVSATKAGHEALGVDMDPQYGLELWMNARQGHQAAEHLPMFQTATANPDEWRDVFSHVPNYDFVVIDMPPGIKDHEASIYEIARRVDMVLMPCGQSQMDMMHIVPWMGRFKERGIKSAFVLNKISPKHWSSYKTAKGQLVATADVIQEVPFYEDIVQTGNGISALDSARMKGNLEFDSLFSTVQRAVGL